VVVRGGGAGEEPRKKEKGSEKLGKSRDGCTIGRQQRRNSDDTTAALTLSSTSTVSLAFSCIPLLKVGEDVPTMDYIVPSPPPPQQLSHDETSAILTAPPALLAHHHTATTHLHPGNQVPSAALREPGSETSRAPRRFREITMATPLGTAWGQ
jgi:hypothetical protein